MKKNVSRALVNFIPDFASLFINIGTTTEAIARALLQHKGLKIITNNINVAKILSEKSDFEVLIASGRVRPDGGGNWASNRRFFKQFKVDFAIIGISGIDSDGTLLDFDFQEVCVSQAIIQGARQVFLAADHSKFGRHAMMRLGSLDDIEMLFTDNEPDKNMVDQIDQCGIKLVVAN